MSLIDNLKEKVKEEIEFNKNLRRLEKEEYKKAKVEETIKFAHAKAKMESKMDIALYTIDPTSGFIIACALMHPTKKLESINLKRMKKRFKNKAFAKGASREQMQECVKMGVDLDDFLVTCLLAMQGISDQLGL